MPEKLFPTEAKADGFDSALRDALRFLERLTTPRIRRWQVPVILGLAFLLASCSPQNPELATAIATEQPIITYSYTPTPSPETTTQAETPIFLATPTPDIVFDYCSCDANDPKKKAYCAPPEELPLVEVVPSNVEALTNTEIDPENIILNTDATKINTLTIPVGFDNHMEEARQIMQEQLAQDNIVFADLPVNFGWLNQSIPIGISRKLHHGIINDPSEYTLLINRLRLIDPLIDKLVFLVRSEEYFGIADYYGKYAIVSSSDIYKNRDRGSLYLSLHEKAHIVGDRDDRYETYYYDDYFPVSELWVSGLPPRAIDLAQDELVAMGKISHRQKFDTGNVCKGEPVFSFEKDGTDLMGGLAAPPWHLNELQKILFRDYALDWIVQNR